MIYFNEIDPFAAEWLGNLFPDSRIDTKSIKDVDLSRPFRRRHYFAGIGGWEYALQFAGWPDEWHVWTGSCPCQPFSAAGKRRGEADERHLWPDFLRLIAAGMPPVVFGEQVASKDGREWLARVRLDLEELGYDVGAADLCAAGVGAPHIRQRLFWVAVADKSKFCRVASTGEQSVHEQSLRVGGLAVSQCDNSERRERVRIDIRASGDTDGLADAGHDAQQVGPWLPRRKSRERKPVGSEFVGDCRVSGLGDADMQGWQGRQGRQGERCDDGEKLTPTERASRDAWADAIAIDCRDGKSRRVGRGVQPLAYGIPRDVGRRFPQLREVAKDARRNRIGRLRGYGNAIVPQIAAVFIQTVIEWLYEAESSSNA